MKENSKCDHQDATNGPLATFIVLAYNQEDFIADAVYGAFAQTYQPLEIILSDDASSDNTFNIMSALAKEYQGPHKIIVRKSKNNRGLGIHFRDVVSLAQGEVIIVAAGDDISLPERTSVMVDFLQSSDANCAESSYNKISEGGRLLEANVTRSHESNYLRLIVRDDPTFCILGATAAYKKSFLLEALRGAKRSIDTGWLYHEDQLFSVFCSAVRSAPLHYRARALVNHRLNGRSISNYSIQRKSFQDELRLIERELFVDKSQLCILSAIRELSEKYPELAARVQLENLNGVVRRAEFRILCNSKYMMDRLRSLALVRSLHDMRIFLPRIFGPRGLTGIRMVRNYFFGQ